MTSTAQQPGQDTAGEQSTPNVLLNHVEFIHRPGEAELVIELFESLGCHCFQVDAPPWGKYIVVHMQSEPGYNDFFASEAEDAQIELNDAFQRHIDGNGSDLAAAYKNFRTMLEQRPYRATHVGVRFPTIADFDAVIDRLESMIAGKFADRIVMGEIFARTVEEAPAGGGLPIKQVWVWTNLISTGLLAMGEQIELQTYA
jgi:hypothetical protein